MEYKRIHDLIIERAKTRVLDGYGENHHIIPKCLGGDDDISNIVKLTAREHFIIHKLLSEIYPENTSLFRAYWLMANKVKSSIQERNYGVGNREYERLRIEFSKVNSESMKGNKYWEGRTHTEESKKKMSREFSESHRRKLSESAKKRKPNRLGVKLSDEVKEKIKNNSSNAKPVIHLETGMIYSSIADASIHCNIATRNIFNHCNNLVKNPKFKFEHGK